MVVMQDASAEMQGYEWKDDCKDDCIDYCNDCSSRDATPYVFISMYS
jgi:hypothetical protein